MAAFAYYRLPYLHHAVYVEQREGEPEVLASVAQLNGKEGFVMAPFAPSPECPVVLMHPDESSLLQIADNAPRKGTDGSERIAENATGLDEQEKQVYANDFALFHDQLDEGVFRKIVLARKLRLNTDVSAEMLFMRACRMFPRLFVALFCTEKTGMWLMATPEVLLRGDGREFATMSLAGTQKAQPSRTVADYPVEGVVWSEKNREEQQYVTDYIELCVKGFADCYSVKGPYTTMAANLYHLRTDISFRMEDTSRLGDVLERLYPTPAVCGIPKEEARRFILANEHEPRKYYSGFVGPLSLSGKTRLFVSLRCMNILQDGTCELYAGGGLLKESEAEKEWAETEAKMETMKRVLY